MPPATGKLRYHNQAEIPGIESLRVENGIAGFERRRPGEGAWLAATIRRSFQFSTGEMAAISSEKNKNSARKIIAWHGGVITLNYKRADTLNTLIDERWRRV
jgi:hypothetical protein